MSLRALISPGIDHGEPNLTFVIVRQLSKALSSDIALKIAMISQTEIEEPQRDKVSSIDCALSCTRSAILYRASVSWKRLPLRKIFATTPDSDFYADRKDSDSSCA